MAALVAFLVAGAAGACGTWVGLKEYQRYQQLLSTVDSLVAVAAKNIQNGKLDGLQPPVPPAPSPMPPPTK